MSVQEKNMSENSESVCTFATNCSIEKEEGLAHEKVFMSSVKISTANGVLFMMGDEKSRVREAENSAASLMIRSLQESDYL